MKFESSDTNLKSDITQTPELLPQDVDNSTLSSDKSDNVSLKAGNDSSDKLIPMDVSLPSQYLFPNLDDSSSDEETQVTELCTEIEPTIHDNGKEMQSINSEAESLVDTVTSTVFESKDEPTQMTKQSFTIIYFITYKKTIHFKLICKNVHS